MTNKEPLLQGISSLDTFVTDEEPCVQSILFPDLVSWYARLDKQNKLGHLQIMTCLDVIFKSHLIAYNVLPSSVRFMTAESEN